LCIYISMKIILAASIIGAAAGGSIELVSGDIAGSGKVLDNIKGKWSQTLNVFGKQATVTGEYDRNENQNSLKEVSLSGALDKMKYCVSSRFGDALDYSLETTTDDGTTWEVKGDVQDLKARVSKVTASRSTSLSGLGQSQDCDLELSHSLPDSASKLKLSTALGSNLKAVGLLSSTAGQRALSYEFEYDTQLTEGRTLSATINPGDGSGEVEFEDSASMDAVINAKLPFGGTPKVTIKRAFGF